MQYQIMVEKPPLVISLADLDELLPCVLFEDERPVSGQTRSANNSKPLPADIWDRVTRYLDTCDHAISEERGHNTTFRVLCKVINGFNLSPEQSWEAAVYYNDTKCDPPWSEKELKHKVDDAFKANHEKPCGHLLEADSDYNAPLSIETPSNKRLNPGQAQAEQLVEPVKALPSGAPAQAKDGSPADQDQGLPNWAESLRSAACSSRDLRGLEIKPRKQILSDFFLECDLGFVYAPRGIGKSWLGLLIARGISSGEGVGPWLVYEQQKVAYFDGEMMIDDIRKRDAALGEPCDDLGFINHEILLTRSC